MAGLGLSAPVQNRSDSPNELFLERDLGSTLKNKKTVVGRGLPGVLAQ